MLREINKKNPNTLQGAFYFVRIMRRMWGIIINFTVPMSACSHTLKHSFLIMQMNYYMRDVARITGGALREGRRGDCFPVMNLLTDSRNIEAGEESLFFAISTEANDGLRYVPALYARGVRNFVVETLPDASLPDACFVVVPSAVKALQQLAATRRRDFGGKVVAVTGSRGKTVVKEWLYRALEGVTEAVRSPRSYNSQIGVPLSLWQLGDRYDVAVIEAGISGTGEMETLRSLIEPEMVIITNVGDEHAAGFRSRREHVAEKVALAAGASTVIYDADDPLVKEMTELMADESKLLLGISRKDESAPLYVGAIAATEEGGTRVSYRFRGREESLELPFAGEWMVADALYVLAALLLLGVEPARVSWIMRGLHPFSIRIDVNEGVNDCLLAYDNFPCDLFSLESALDFINRRADEQGRSRTLVLASLRHEGMEEREVCARVCSLMRLARIDRFIGVSPLFQRHADMFPPSSRLFASESELMEHMSTSDFVSEFILVKGAPDSGLEALKVELEARTHETVLEVNLDSIVKNFNYFRSFLPHSSGLIAMVKASGYGAGSLEIAKTLQAQGAAYLAVAVLDEGIELRHAGITMPIMVMNPKVLNYKAMFAHRLEPEIYNMEMLRDVMREAAKCDIEEYPIHIKLDTGMHRTGFNTCEIPELLALLQSTRSVKVSTLFSHLATADCLDMDEYTLGQLHRFEEDTTAIMRGLPYKVKRHVLNTAGIVRFPQYHYDFARLGIGLYGVNTLPPEVEKPLHPVSTLRTVIIELKERQAGEAIGYARRDVLKAPAMIATIPIGYADGMNRRFGNGRSRVLVNGREVPTIGNICMDSCMIDVTGVPCKVGDSVEIFGVGMSVQRLADTLDTIPYEVLTSVSPRVKRIYYRE